MDGWREIKGQTVLHRIKAAVKNGKHSKVVQKNRVRRYGHRQERMMTGWKNVIFLKCIILEDVKSEVGPGKRGKRLTAMIWLLCTYNVVML